MKMIPEMFELVTWADIEPGDHVWYMGNVMVIRDTLYRNDDDYDRTLRKGYMRAPVRDENGSEFGPPVELTERVARLVPPRLLEADAERQRLIAQATREHLKNMESEGRRFAMELSHIENVYALRTGKETR